MNEDHRRALEELRFDWAVAPDDVWERSPFHVDGLHGRAAAAVLGGIQDARSGSGASPIGLVIEGQRGAGKTHMLGWVREQVAYRGGYFFLVGLYEADKFWESVSLGVVDGLLRVTRGDTPQVVQALTRLAHRAGISDEHRAGVTGAARLSVEALDAFVAGVRPLDRRLRLSGQDTLRALALYASRDNDESDLGYDHLTSVGAMEDAERRRWGLKHPPKGAQHMLGDVSSLLALTGPTVVAIDQIDALVAESRHKALESGDEDLLVVDQVAAGLMSLRDVTRRTLSLLACLPDTWEHIKSRAVATVGDRFREASQLKAIPSVEVGRALVEKRFGVRFRRIGFVPPYPTWPVAEAAFADVMDFTPRGLLRRIDRHVEMCLAEGVVRDLDDLNDGVAVADPAPVVTPPPKPAMIGLDRRFAELRREAEVSDALDPGSEDEVVPRALAAGLSAWIAEQGENGRSAFALDALPGRKPALHARLRQTLDEETEHEAHWSFRAIGATHGVAALSRLRAARTAAGLQEGARGRHLVLLRTGEWSKGAKTQAELAAVRALGAQEYELTEDDLRSLFALEALLRQRPHHLQAWLASRRPASSTKLLGTVLGGVARQFRSGAPAEAESLDAEPGAETHADAAPSPLPAEGGAPGAEGQDQVAAASGGLQPDLVSDSLEGAGLDVEHDSEPPSLLVGVDTHTGQIVRLGLESLRRHTAIFAGSGSGKTVLIRRLIEDCARQGVSAIVLDPNNDLARLGDPWPDQPSGWLPGDADRAADYFAGTEVVVWTPGRESGNPLSFQPLPDFAAVSDDPDELDAAIEAAVSTLAPHAKVDGRTARAQLGRAVLKEALRYFAEAGHGGLPGFMEVLSSLPVGVSSIKDATRIGRDIAQLLTAATVNDPLFGGAGAVADPGLLLTPSPGKRARVSVVNFVGLPADEARQGFVNQLQMALFAWVKAHPAGDRPLGGLFVMDEAQTLAPSGEMTPCTRSTLTLASQARKYGLGLMFATQAPKGLHNRIPGNAFTQFFGYLNSPSQIAVANEMARAKGSRVPDISRVGTGEFFVSGEGVAFQRTKVPLCLSQHPRSPLTTEEVLARARASAAAIGRANGPR